MAPREVTRRYGIDVFVLHGERWPEDFARTLGNAIMRRNDTCAANLRRKPASETPNESARAARRL